MYLFLSEIVFILFHGISAFMGPISVEMPDSVTLSVRSLVLPRINIQANIKQKAPTIHSKETVTSLTVKDRRNAPLTERKIKAGQIMQIRITIINLGDFPSIRRKN